MSVKLVPWHPDHQAFFTLTGDDWSPPALIRTTLNQRRDRLVIEGTWRQPDGTRVKLRTVAALQGGDWFVVEEHVDLTLTVEGRP